MSLHLIGDIGGTNLRFALVEQGRVIREGQQTWQAQPSLVQAARAFLGSDQPVAAALAIAAKVTPQDVLHMPNVPTPDRQGYYFSRAHVQAELGLAQLHVFNDFTAIALALPYVQAADVCWVGPHQQADTTLPLAVLGAGTGLGVSASIPTPHGPVPLTTEGGHVTLAPGNEQEEAVIRHLRQEYGHVSAERLLSGMGLENIYRSLCQLEDVTPLPLSAADITTQALAHSNPQCTQTLHMFCALMGQVAGNVALTTGALGGVYIAGGIIPRILPFFTQSAFRARFEAKGRYESYMQAIPTGVITLSNPAYFGLTQFLAHAA